MPSPLQHLETGSLIGSWPLALAPSFAAPTLLPNTLNAQATILGIRRAASYAIGSKSFILDLDPFGGGAPVAHTVSFPAGAYTLAQIITLINTDVVNVTPPISEVAAFDDNGFLRLKSPRGGNDSYVGIRSVFGAEDIFIELGLFSGTVSKGGSLKQAQHVDPSRQIALPGQLGMQWGETFSVDVFNRAALQLGWNTDLAHALTDLKKVSTLQEESFVGTGALSYQLNLANPLDGVYTGPVSTPDATQLKDQIIVLDENGNELVKEYEHVLSGPTADYDVEMIQEGGPTNGFKSFVVKSMTATFSDSDVTDNVYVIITDLPVPDTALNDVPLKVVAHLDAATYPGGYAGVCVVMNLDAATGQRRTLTGSHAGLSGRKVEILPLRAEIEAFYKDAGLTIRAEQLQDTLESQAVTKIEKNNRVRCSAALFITNGVQTGDLVVWSAASSTDPYTNNGNYRVSKVVDENVVELVDENFGPVFLNPNVAGGFGSIAVSTDGSYWRTPYVKFADPTNGGNRTAGRGGVPDTGENFSFAYQVGLPLRTATDPRSVTGSISRGKTVRNELKADGNVQRQLLRVLGPAPVKFDDLMMSRYSDTLEHLFFKLSEEHHTTDRGGFGAINTLGRHSTIRPDIIDFYQGATGDGKGSLITSGTSFTMRASAADDAGTPTQVLKMRGRNAANSADLWGLSNEGSLGIGRGLIAEHGTNPQDTFPASYGWYDLMIDRLGSGRNAIGQLRAENSHWIISGTKPNVTNDVGLLDKSVAALHMRYSGTAAGTTVTDWMLSFARQNTGAEANDIQILKLDLLQLLGGSGPANILVIDRKGSTGINMGVGFGATIVPVAGLHVRARDPAVFGAADKLLLLLEGWDADQDSVAIAWKPRRDLPLFGFMEVDHDPNPPAAGDWIMNSVLTSDAKTASNGALAEAYWRWIQDATGGSGTERMRLFSKTLELRLNKRYITSAPAISNDTISPAILVSILNQDETLSGFQPPFTNILEVAPAPAAPVITGLRFYAGVAESLTTIKGFNLFHNAAPTDPLGTTYTRDVVAENALWMQYQQPADGSIIGAGGKALGALYVRSNHVDIGSPFVPPNWVTNFELTLPGGADALPTRLTLADGVIRLQPRGGTYTNGSNPEYGPTSIIERNALYALSLNKHWIHVKVVAGVASATDRDGFNVNVAAIVGTKLRITTQNNLAGLSTGIIAMPMTSNSGIVSFNCVVTGGAIYELEAVKHDGTNPDLSNVGTDCEVAVLVFHRD